VEAEPKDFLSLAEWPRAALEGMLERARELRAARARGDRVRTLEGRSVLLYFEKPSLRTQVTFEVGIGELGGTSVYLPPGQVRIGDRETPEDVARNLSLWCHAIVARTFSHELLLRLARHATIPVVNGLSDDLHPCQALADVLTLLDHGDPRRDRLVYLGDGNNVCHSLVHAAGRFGLRLTVCTPPAYGPRPEVVRRGQELAAGSGGEIRLETDPRAAVKDAAFVYTDVWASMGREAEAAARHAAFRPYQLNAELLASAPAGARVLHCLPAHRGEEITGEVLDSERSLVLQQAANRLHAQKAILEHLVHR
jgi:ornithine carbamoyltransferase